MALNLAQTKNLNLQSLKESKIATNTTNGGFDEATWGKLDVTKWQGSAQDGIYQLTSYTGDLSHIIVPNEADFEKAGKSTNGLQVGITRDTVSLLPSSQGQTIAFSKTNNQKVKAIGTDWSKAFFIKTLSKFDGSNLDTSNVTNMSNMFDTNKISNLTSLANWDTSKVTNMSGMFGGNQISDLTPLTNWDTSKVTNMSDMFENNKISDLTPLANWNTGNVTNMSNMFNTNKISDLTPLANWNVSKVTNMNEIFESNPDITDLGPIANWNISNINTDVGFGGLFGSDNKLNLTNINNTPLMQGFLKAPDAFWGATFITNNADLAKATTDKDFPNLTNTAKRTITFNLPHATPKTIVQIINYKAIAPVQIDWSDYDSDSPQIVKAFAVKEPDWQLDTSKQNDDVIIDGVINFKPVTIPHVNGYKAHLIKDPVNPTAFLVSFMAVPEQRQNNQSTSNNDQSSQTEAQAKQKQPEPIQTQPVEDKQVDQGIDQISYTLMHNSSSNTDSFEPVQGDSTSLENSSDLTQNSDAAKLQKANIAKHKKHIVKKRVVKKHKKHVKKYHLRKRSRKYSKKRVIKHRKRALRKFRRFHLKRIKRVKH